MDVHVDIENLTDGHEEASELVHAVRRGVEHAAEEGIRAAQQRHPYQDRTGRLTGSAQAAPTTEVGELDVEFEMAWPAPYAGFVDEGTVHAKPYPFTPIAEARAEEVLVEDVERAVDAYVSRITGG